MASTSRDGTQEGVEFIHEDDGSLTARDLETFLIVVPHETPVIDLVPERGGRVQQVP